MLVKVKFFVVQHYFSQITMIHIEIFYFNIHFFSFIKCYSSAILDMIIIIIILVHELKGYYKNTLLY